MCKTCPVGFVSADDANACTVCVGGQYQHEEQKTTCLECAKGKFAADKVTACDDCAAGQQQSHASAINYFCVPCIKGQMASTVENVCEDCTIGRYQEFNIANSYGNCKSCPVGRTAPSSGAMCLDCPNGRFQDLSESLVYSCKQCDAGSAVFGPEEGYQIAGCIVCLEGAYQPEPSPTEFGCIKCPPGKINADATQIASMHDSFDDCIDCAIGQYQVIELFFVVLSSMIVCNIL